MNRIPFRLIPAFSLGEKVKLGRDFRLSSVL